MLGSGYDVVQKDQVKSFWGSTFMKLKKLNSFIPKQRQAPVHTNTL
jgi:hypothetical protein